MKRALPVGLVVLFAGFGLYCAKQTTPRAPIVASAAASNEGPTRVVRLGAGISHTCALLDDGSLRCWGADDYGQLGAVPRPALPDGSRGSAVPVPAYVLRDAVALSLGASQTCLLGEDGTVRCVGERIHLENARKAPEAPLTIEVGEPAVAISAGSGQLCVVLESGSASCLGRDTFQGPFRGVEPRTTKSGIELADLGEDFEVSAIGAGTDVCVIHEAGKVRCWRSTEEFRDGGENQEEVSLPAPAKELSVHAYYGGCALLETRAVHCWFGGQAGPIEAKGIALDGPARQVETGLWFSCAVLESGALRCWGRDHYFKGARKLGEELFAIDLGGAVKSIAVGELHACALFESGAVRCFGDNHGGQLGYGHLNDIGDDETVASAGEVPVLARPPEVREWHAPPPSASAASWRAAPSASHWPAPSSSHWPAPSASHWPAPAPSSSARP